MFRSPFVSLSALAAVLAGALTLPAAAAVSHSHTSPHKHTTHVQKTAYHGHHAGHRHAAVHRGSRHHAKLAPESRTVSETIDPEPMVNMHVAPMVGSHESLVRQNERTEADGLSRIEDDAELNELRREKALVAVPVNASLRINEGLPVNRRYCRPWTAKFLIDLARAHATRFHRPLQVNSAVRTVAYQRRLIEINGNAAPAEGDIASPHLSGATIDIAKKGLSMSEVAWMRGYLLPLQMAGKLDVEEEFYQSCFHITVYKSYVPAPATPRAPARRPSASLLAEHVR